MTVEHAEATSRFPRLHKDPFDRLLLAQTQVERLTLITQDSEIVNYEVLALAA
ncbi:MAG: hypothetical protein AAGG48_18260 [Planctomycetota bacterium]